MVENEDDVRQAAIACQMQAQAAYWMSTVNGHVWDKKQEATIWWQGRARHWAAVARRLMRVET